MYAFNKRFRPTLHFGAFTITTLAFGALGALLLVFSVGAVFQMKSPPAAVVLFAGALASVAFAINEHLNLPRRRLKASMFKGRRDRARQRLELHG